jgi:protein-S-isoprenylcysteine O-methyltransferase Ste14
MKTSMTLFGCGPKLALLCLPYVILSLSVMYKYHEFFDLRFLDFGYAKVLGFIWLGLGVFFWIYSAFFFLRHFKPGNLMTYGPFALCRNPIYSSIIVFIIPSLALIFHSGLLFSISIVLYIGFKISIHGETIVLRRLFGEEYEIYEKSVNEIIPFPQFLFRGKSVHGHDS